MQHAAQPLKLREPSRLPHMVKHSSWVGSLAESLTYWKEFERSEHHCASRTRMEISCLTPKAKTLCSVMSRCGITDYARRRCIAVARLVVQGRHARDPRGRCRERVDRLANSMTEALMATNPRPGAATNFAEQQAKIGRVGWVFTRAPSPHQIMYTSIKGGIHVPEYRSSRRDSAFIRPVADSHLSAGSAAVS